MISFVIPAHNEEAHVGTAITAIRAAAARAFAGREWEVVVADDSSTDRTGEIAAAAGARVVRVEKRQISATRNAGAAAATRGPDAARDILVFVDADTLVTPQAVRGAVEAMEQGAAGGGAPVGFDGEIPRWSRVMLPVVLGLFRVLKLSGGAFMFARRDHFEAVGGWDETVYASEELRLAKALKRRGRFVLLRTRVVTSGRKLRTYPARRIFGTLFRLMLRGPRSVRSRDLLGIWYDPRPPDPHARPGRPAHREPESLDRTAAIE